MKRRHEKISNLLANTLFDGYISTRPASLEETGDFLKYIHLVRKGLCSADTTPLSFIERAVYNYFVKNFKEGIKECTVRINRDSEEREQLKRVFCELNDD